MIALFLKEPFAAAFGKKDGEKLLLAEVMSFRRIGRRYKYITNREWLIYIIEQTKIGLNLPISKARYGSVSCCDYYICV